MNFSLDANGAQALGSGLGGLFKTAAMGRLYGQQGEMNAALRAAQIQHHQASADKALTEAEQGRAALAIQNDPIENAMLSLGLPRALAPAFRNKIDSGSWGGGYDTPSYDGVGPTMPAPAGDDTVKKLAQAMSVTQRMLATGSKVQQGTDAALDEQKMRIIDSILSNPQAASSAGKAYAATTGKPLFNDVGNTGYSMDNFTGAQSEANPLLAKIFASKEGSTTGLNNARRDRVTSGLDKPVTVIDDETGKATITAIPTTGDPRTIGVAPAKGTGVDATNAKARNAIIAAVEKEMPYADEVKISAEVEKRLARRGMGGNKTPTTPKIPDGYKQIGTSNGKPVYQAPDGKKYIFD